MKTIVFVPLIYKRKNFYLFKTSISVKQVMIAILGIYAALIVWEVILFI